MLPKHWWEGTDANGQEARHHRRRRSSRRSAPGPTGSRASTPAATSTYERVKDYWGKDCRASRDGTISTSFASSIIRDANVLLEAFKGDQYDFRIENSAKNWATGYDFPAAKEGRVVLEEFAERASGPMQAFVFNLRRAEVPGPAGSPRVQPRPSISRR